MKLRDQILLGTMLCYFVLSINAQTGASAGLSPGPTHSSNLLAPVERDAKAIAVLNQALIALGGQAALRQISSLEIIGHWNDDASQQFVWRTSGSNYRMSSTHAGITAEISSIAGKTFRTADGPPVRIEGYIGHSMFVPGAVGLSLLRMYSNPEYRLEYVGTSTLGEDNVLVVKSSLPRNTLDSLSTAQTWYFSTSSWLPIRVDYRVFDVNQFRRFVDATMYISKYLSIQGVKFPQYLVVSLNGKRLHSATTSAVTINSKFEDDPALVSLTRDAQ